MTRSVCGFVLLAGFLSALGSLASSAEHGWQSSSAARPEGSLVFRAVVVEDQDDRPAAAGKAAAEKLKAALGDAPLQAVLVAECFEDLDRKRQLLQGVCSVIPADLVFGEATYGAFTQDGSAGADAVCLLGIGGDGVSVAATLVTELGVAKLTFQEHEQEIKDRLQAAGAKLVGQLRRTDQDRLLLLIADAHSPKNQFLVEGAQRGVGGTFPITGGSANKNAGQTFVYFQGQPHSDSAIALMLSGNFRVALAGRKAMDNDQVIATAKEAAAQALAGFGGKPTAVLAFDCAGRRGKLRRPADELVAIQAALGRDLPLFGCYCAGEVGPLDVTEKPAGVLSGGGGWHVMFTVIGR